MKIGGASLEEDLRRVEAVIKVVGGGGNLAVDANGRFDRETAIAYARALRPYDLFWYEEAEKLGWTSRRMVPHGGHQMSLNIAAGLHLGGNESYPDVFQQFGGFADGISVAGGYVGLPDIPGVGFEAKSKLYALLSELA